MKTKSAAALGIKHLYHYQTFEKPERLARMFTDGTLYFSQPRDFNDPWDCRPFFNKSALDDPAYYDRAVRWFVHCDRTYNTALSDAEPLRREKEIRGNRKLLERMIDQMTTDMETAIQQQYRVYCLSLHPDSVLMWAHYAASCRGVCLEFSVENELFCGALPVTYLDSYPQFDIAATDADENLQHLLTKSAVWSYEDEFRVVVSEHPFVFPDVPTTKGSGNRRHADDFPKLVRKRHLVTFSRPYKINWCYLRALGQEDPRTCCTVKDGQLTFRIDESDASAVWRDTAEIPTGTIVKW